MDERIEIELRVDETDETCEEISHAPPTPPLGYGIEDTISYNARDNVKNSFSGQPAKLSSI